MGKGLTLAALLGLCLAATQARATDASIQTACRNESGLFCPGKKGRALTSCLKARSDGASKACKARLAGSAAPDAAVLPDAAVPDRVRYPDIAVDVDVVTYNVDGTDAEDLRAQLDSLGPFDPVLKRHVAGKTKDDIRWSFDSKRTAAGCAVDSVEVSITVRQELPEWHGVADADKTLAASWRRFLTALKTHEDGHKEIALKTGQGIYQAVKTQPPQADCAGLSKAAADAAGVWLEKEKRENQEYDRRTKHGLNQGAVFR